MKGYKTIKLSIKFICAAFLCGAFFCLSVAAQFDSATVLGTVREAAQAVVPNVTVKLTNIETGVVVTAATDS